MTGREANVIVSKELARQVKWLANRIIAPRHVEREDLIQEGYAAIVQAAPNYDPARGASFTTFAVCVAWHAMLSYLKQQQTRSCDESQSIVGSATLQADGKTIEEVVFDYRSDDTVPHKRACCSEILELAQNVLSDQEYETLIDWLGGETLAGIAERKGLTRARTHMVFHKALRILRWNLCPDYEYELASQNTSRLTEEQVLRIAEIREAEGIGSKLIARRLGLREYLVRDVINGDTWSHVTRYRGRHTIRPHCGKHHTVSHSQK